MPSVESARQTALQSPKSATVSPSSVNPSAAPFLVLAKRSATLLATVLVSLVSLSARCSAGTSPQSATLSASPFDSSVTLSAIQSAMSSVHL
jgi:hypothetical protein